MDANYQSATATSPFSDQASFVSTATVKELSRVSPSRRSPSLSPMKPTSPTVRISKSPVSEFQMDGRQISTSAVELAVNTSESELRTKRLSEDVDIDLTDANEMEVEPSRSPISKTEKQRRSELFEEFEEINPVGELDEEGEIEEEVEDMDVGNVDNEEVSSSTGVTSGRRSVTSGRRTVTGGKVVETEAVRSGIKVEATELVLPPEPARQLHAPTQPAEPEVFRKFPSIPQSISGSLYLFKSFDQYRLKLTEMFVSIS